MRKVISLFVDLVNHCKYEILLWFLLIFFEKLIEKNVIKNDLFLFSCIIVSICVLMGCIVITKNFNRWIGFVSVFLYVFSIIIKYININNSLNYSILLTNNIINKTALCLFLGLYFTANVSKRQGNQKIEDGTMIDEPKD